MLIKDLEILICDFWLGRFWYGLLVFIVKKDGRLLGIKELGS